MRIQWSNSFIIFLCAYSVIEPEDGYLTGSNDEVISTYKQFVFTALGNKDLQLERLQETLTMGQSQCAVDSVLEFRQRARMILKQWMKAARQQLT